MNRVDIQERIEAIIEDVCGVERPFAMRDETESFFEPEDLCTFCDLLTDEFGVDGFTLVPETRNFYELIELIAEELQ